MTHEEFWKLYEAEEIKVKIYTYENREADHGELALAEIDAYTYDGKYYLRVCNNYEPKGYRRRYKNAGWSWSEIKEFDTKEQANAWFQSVAAEYIRVQ